MLKSNSKLAKRMQENLDLGWQRYGTRRRKSLFALFCCGSLGLRTFLWLFSTVRFQMSSQIACLRKGIFAVVAYIVKCLFKLFAWKDARSHSLNLFGLFPVCFSNVSTNGKTRRMQSHTRCICPIFLHFTFGWLYFSFLWMESKCPKIWHQRCM